MRSEASTIAFRWLLGPFLAVTVALAAIGEPLKTAAAPHGIVTLELCALTADCNAILQTWSASQREYAMLSLGLDYLYLVLYPAVIASALLSVSARLAARFRLTAFTLAWLVALAGAADAVENYCLIRLLSTGRVSEFAMPAGVFASAKFAVIAAALVCLAIGASLALCKRRDA